MVRINLRPANFQDREAVRDLFSDGKIAPFLASVPNPYEDEWFDKRLEFQSNGRLQLFVIASEQNPTMGLIGFFFKDPNSKDVADVMYCVHSKLWGQGIAGQALPKLMDKMRSIFVKRVETGAHFDNPASLHLLEKNGFEFQKEIMEYSLGRQTQVKTLLFSCDL